MKAIHLGFSFLKQKPKLLIATLIRVVEINIGDVTIHRALSINKCVKNKKQRIVKRP